MEQNPRRGRRRGKALFAEPSLQPARLRVRRQLFRHSRRADFTIRIRAPFIRLAAGVRGSRIRPRLMKPVTELGKIANWIAPPKTGVNHRPFEFEYVRL